MPKQKGIIKMEGTIGDITFMKTQDGYIAKEKTHISAGRIAGDKAFQRTRENNAEFGRAGKAGKLFRAAINSLLQDAKDNRVTSRLTTAMLKVVKSDPVGKRGQRTVAAGNLALLEGFEFNINSQMSATFKEKIGTTINRSQGQLDVNLPAFIPSKSVNAPAGTTHFKIVSAGVEIDFESGNYVEKTSATDSLPLDINQVDAITLSNAVTPASVFPLFILTGIQFYQRVNGDDYALSNGIFNALSLVKTEAA